MKGQDLARLRLRTQRLSGPPFDTPVDVVRSLAAVQSQEFAVAHWSIGRRLRGATSADVEQALADGSILRTHVLRPTWHFVLPEDIRWMVPLTAPRVRAAMAPYDRKLGLTDAVFAKSQAVMAKALAAGKSLTRGELASVLEETGIEASGQRLGNMLMRAEQDLLVCSGAPRGKQHTYALVERRVPPSAALTGDEALARLTTRYFAGHGPATLKDFTWWSSLTLAEAKRGVGSAGRRLQSLTVDDRTYFTVETSIPRRPSAPAAQLLQGYDEYIIGYGDTRWLLNLHQRAGVLPRGHLMFTHAVLMDGQVVGHWRRGTATKEAVVEAFFVRPLVAGERRALDAEVARYGTFLGKPARLEVTSTW